MLSHGRLDIKNIMFDNFKRLAKSSGTTLLTTNFIPCYWILGRIPQKLTQLNQQQEQNARALTEMAVSYEFQKREMGCEETNQLSFWCYIPLSILGETWDGNHGTKPHHPLHSACLPHQQTFDLPSYMQEIETGSFG